MVAAAVAVVGAIGGGLLAANATSNAADTAAAATTQASTTAAQVQRDALAQQKELAQPYTDLGKQAIPTLESLLGIAPAGKPGAAAGPTPQQTLEQLPGYQFAKTQGIDATKAAAASMGLALSGNTLEGIDKFSTGLADQTYGEEVNRLMGIAGLGQAAAAGQAANIGQGAANLGNIAMNQGNTLAGIAANQGASMGSIYGNIGGSIATAATLRGLNPGATAAPAYTPMTIQDVPSFTPDFGGSLGPIPNAGIQ